MQIPLRFNRGQAKPWGSIPRINWDHPLSNGLVLCAYDIGGTVIDLVGGSVATTTFGTTVPATSPMGSATSYGGAGGPLVEWNPIQPRLASFGLNSPWSLATVVFKNTLSPAGTGAAPTQFSTNSSGNNDAVSMGYDDTDPTKATFATENSSITSATATIAANKFYTLVGVQSPSSTGTLYVNGANVGSAAMTNYNVASTVATINGWGTFNGAGNATGDTIFMILCWDKRALTQSESLQLYQDPYGFLIYPEDEILATIFGTAAGVTDILMAQAWM